MDSSALKEGGGSLLGGKSMPAVCTLLTGFSASSTLVQASHLLIPYTCTLMGLLGPLSGHFLSLNSSLTILGLSVNCMLLTLKSIFLLDILPVFELVS